MSANYVRALYYTRFVRLHGYKPFKRSVPQ